MVQPAQVHQLVHHHVVAHPFRHPHEPPVEADMTVAPAGAPARALIADADAADRETVRCRQLHQSRGEFLLRPADERAALLDGQQRQRRQPRTLSRNPVMVPIGEGSRFPL